MIALFDNKLDNSLILNDLLNIANIDYFFDYRIFLLLQILMMIKNGEINLILFKGKIWNLNYYKCKIYPD